MAHSRSCIYYLTCFVLLQGVLEANPKEGKIVSGSASISSKGKKIKIDQSSKHAIIHWQDFSIQEGEIAEFSLPHRKAATLNRVTGVNLSEIAGHLSSNGILYLINPNGILVGPTGVINAAGVVLSTLNLSNDDFLLGRSLNFSGESEAKIVNLGKISTLAGDVHFIGQAIVNQGSIDAPEGGVYLSGGREVLLLPEGDQRIQIKVPVSESMSGNTIDQTGMIEAAHVEIEAKGGNPYALAVKSSGAVHVKGFAEKEGQIFLTAEEGSIEVSGMLAAEKENGSGGEITVSGNRVNITPDATIIASSMAEEGHGGQVYLLGGSWASLDGDVFAHGGTKKGDGGFIELSAPVLECLKPAYAKALDGVSRPGEFLIDPYNVWVAAATGTQPLNWSVVLTTSIASAINAGMAFTINTSSSANYDLVGSNTFTGLITVNDPVSLIGTGLLSFIADDSITVNNAISNSMAGGYSFTAANDISINYPISTLSTDAISFTATAGTLSLNQYMSTTTFGSISSVGDVNLTSGGDLSINSANVNGVSAPPASTSTVTSTTGNISLMTTGTGAIYILGTENAQPVLVASDGVTSNGDVTLTTTSMTSAGDITFVGSISALDVTFMGGTGSTVYIGNDSSGSLSIGTSTSIFSEGGPSTNSLTIEGDAVTIKGGTIITGQVGSGGVQWDNQNLTITANNGDIIISGGDTSTVSGFSEVDMRSDVSNSTHMYSAPMGTIQLLGGTGDGTQVELGPYGLVGSSGNVIVMTGSDMILTASTTGFESGVTLNSGGGTSADSWTIGGDLTLTGGENSGITLGLSFQPSLAATYAITGDLTVASGNGGTGGMSYSPECFAQFFNGTFSANNVSLQAGSSENASITFDSDTDGGTIHIGGNFSAIAGSSQFSSISGVLSTNNGMMGSFTVGGDFTVQGGTGEMTSATIQIGNATSSQETLQIAGDVQIGGASQVGLASMSIGELASFGATSFQGVVLISDNCTVTGGTGGVMPSSTGASTIEGLGLFHMEVGNALQITGGSGDSASAQITSFLFPGATEQIVYVQHDTTIQGGGGGDASAILGLGVISNSMASTSQTVDIGGNLTITGGSGATATASIGNVALIGTFMSMPFDADAPSMTLNVLGNIVCANGTFPGAVATIGGTSGFSSPVPGLSGAPGSVTVQAGGNIQLASSLDVTFSGVSMYNQTHFQTYIANHQFASGAIWPSSLLPLPTSPASIYPVGHGAFSSNNGTSNIVLTTNQGNISILSAQNNISGTSVNFTYGTSAGDFLFATTSGNYYVTGLTDITINSPATTQGNSTLYPGSLAQIEFDAYNTLSVNQPVTISGANFGIELQSDLFSMTAGPIHLAADVTANTTNGFTNLLAHTGSIRQTAGTVTADSITMNANTGITGPTAPYNLLNSAGSVIFATNNTSNNLSIVNTIAGSNAQFTNATLSNGAGGTFANRFLYFEQLGGTSLNVLSATANGDLLVGAIAGQGNLTISGSIIPGRDAMHVANGTVSLTNTGTIQGVGKVTVVCDQAFPASVGPGFFLNNSTSGGITTTDPMQDIAIYAASGPQAPAGFSPPNQVVLGNLSSVATWDSALPDGLASKYDTFYSSGGPVHGPGFSNYDPGNGVFGSHVIWYKFDISGPPPPPPPPPPVPIPVSRQVKAAFAIQGLTLEPWYPKRIAYAIYSVNIVSNDRRTLIPLYDYQLIIPFTSINMRPYDSFEVTQYEINP